MDIFGVHHPSWRNLPRIWKTTVVVTKDNVEIGDLCNVIKREDDFPQVVRVLLINQDGTLTVMEEYNRVANYEPNKLEKPNWHRMNVADIPPNVNFWSQAHFMPQCMDTFNTFGHRVVYRNSR